MEKNAAEEGARWFRQSELDLDDAKFAADGKRYHLACFLSQQAAEKALKALLYSRGAEMVWGHSVADLCKSVQKLELDFSLPLGDAAPLDKYYVPTRYPNGLPGGIPSDAFASRDADLAISMASAVLEAVRKTL